MYIIIIIIRFIYLYITFLATIIIFFDISITLQTLIVKNMISSSSFFPTLSIFLVSISSFNSLLVRFFFL